MRRDREIGKMGTGDESRAVVSVFSFFTVLIAFFLTGFLFLSVDMPLLLGGDVPDHCQTVRGLIATLRASWHKFAGQDLKTTEAIVYCLLALLVGFALQPLAVLLVSLVGKAVSKSQRLMKWLRLREFYVPIGWAPGYAPGYAQFTHMLHENRGAKAAWEWEFFNYYVSCGVALSVAGFLFILLVRSMLFFCHRSAWKAGFWLLLIAFLAFLYCLYHALTRGQVQQNLYEYYKPRARPKQ